MIIVIATVQCLPGCRDQFLEEFRRIVPDVLKEQGCLEYGPTIDVETDLTNQHRDENRVTIVEKWSTVNALKAHLIAPHMEAYRPRVRAIVESSQLRILQAANQLG